MLYEVITLGSGIDPAVHETDLITSFGAALNGPAFGLLVGAIASLALIMAVNTAFVASRITSYNVCYTKLLREASSPDRGGRRKKG